MRRENGFNMPFHRQILLPGNKSMLRALKPYMADELIQAVLRDREQECAKFIQKHTDDGCDK